MKACIRFCIAAPLLLLSYTTNAGELSLREEVRAEGRLLLSNGDTTGIERAAEKYRQARTPAGFWVLPFFYNGISRVNTDDPRDLAWDKAEEVAGQWLKASPQSATAIVVNAEILSERAWAYRGDGFSSTVTKVGSRKFIEYIERAREVLDNNRTAGVLDPTWYVLRISVANAQRVSKEDILNLATQALDRYPYYYPIHYVTTEALEPKWGGSQQLVNRYVVIALEHSKVGEGAQAYARIYFQLVIHAGGDRKNINSLGIEWPRFKESLSEVAAAYPDLWSLNSQRAMACFLWAKEDCKDYITQVDGRYISIAWFDTPQWQQDCVDWTFHGKTFSSDNDYHQNASARFLLLMGCIFIALLIALIVVRNQRLSKQAPPPINSANGMQPMSFGIEQVLKTELGRSERLLWSGVPRQGLLFRGTDILVVPISFLWAGFAVFWEYSVASKGVPFFFMLWGIPFVLLGLYITVGRFFVDSYQRSRTYYAVTDQRVIILGGLINREVKSLALSGLNDVSLNERSDHSGSITFGPTNPAYAMWSGTVWPGMGKKAAPAFDLIPDVRKVFDLIRERQRTSK